MDNHNACEQAWLNGYKQGREAVEKKGPIDVAIVVRCKDCKFNYISHDVPGLRFCTVWDMPNGGGDEGYCHYGERKNA